MDKDGFVALLCVKEMNMRCQAGKPAVVGSSVRVSIKNIFPRGATLLRFG